MWYTWTTLLLVSCALVGAEVEVEVEVAAPATTRAPLRTLDRQAAELAWHSWLQSPESGSQNATHRRITTKSLFITPLNCPKGQRLDRNGCVEVVVVDPKEHERNLLSQLNALFTAAPSNGDVVYDYGDEEQGPYQLSIPIGLDPQAAAAQEPTAQAQNLQANYVKFDKKGEKDQNTDASIEAELELLKLQQAQNKHNATSIQGNIFSQNVLSNVLSYSDKPKRDSPMINATSVESENKTDKGQEELVFGQVNVDPMSYEMQNQQTKDLPSTNNNNESNEAILLKKIEQSIITENNKTTNESTSNTTTTEYIPNSTMPPSKVIAEQIKLNPEHEYSDIGEAIKLISRYADVSTDDIFTKDQRKVSTTEDSILGTRTKLQYRRNRPKVPVNIQETTETSTDKTDITEQKPANNLNLNNKDFYRYPWSREDSATPPPHYPFRHLQDYWPGKNYVGGVYGTHENPRRHHHSYPHYFRPRSYPRLDSPPSQALQEPYPGFRRYTHKLANHNINLLRSHPTNQELYSLLGLRHWFGSEGASKR